MDVWGTADQFQFESTQLTGDFDVHVRIATATFNSSVNPRGLATSYKFEYGPSSSYGSSIPAPEGSAGAGQGFVERSATIEGLEAGTTYHYRVVVSGPEGTADSRAPMASGSR